MARMDFDLEQAQYELEQANNLLEIFSAFCNEECPAEPLASAAVEAVSFASRVARYQSLVYAAQDKIIAMTEAMGEAIKSYSEVRKAKGGDMI